MRYALPRCGLVVEISLSCQGVGSLEEMIDDNHAIVSSSVGPEYSRCLHPHPYLLSLTCYALLPPPLRSSLRPRPYPSCLPLRHAAPYRDAYPFALQGTMGTMIGTM